jgi:hypothetical protein
MHQLRVETDRGPTGYDPGDQMPVLRLPNTPQGQTSNRKARQSPIKPIGNHEKNHQRLADFRQNPIFSFVNII